MTDKAPILDAELEVLRAVTNDLALAVRMGGLAGDPVTLAFVWAQNKDELLQGRTTWEAQWGPHRRLARNGSPTDQNDQGFPFADYCDDLQATDRNDRSNRGLNAIGHDGQHDNCWACGTEEQT